MIVIDLLYNLSTLIALSALSGFINLRFNREEIKGKLLQGLLFGITAIIGMMNPYVLSEGIIFDGRSIIISLCALFFGPLSGILASIIALVYRLSLGGGGMMMGSFVILSSFLAGIFFYKRKKSLAAKKYPILKLYIFGLIVHAFMLLFILLLPSKSILNAYQLITVSVIGVYPIVTVVIGKILLDHEENQKFIKQIKDNERLFRTTLYSIGDGVIITDIDRKILNMNRVAEDLTGWKEEDARDKILKDVFRIFNEDTGEIIENPGERILQIGQVAGFADRTILHCKDGTKKPISESGSTIINDDGSIAGVVVVFSDKTDERIRETRLAESEEKYRTLIENQSDLVVEVDNQGLFEFVSPSYCVLFGKRPEELIGKSFIPLVHEDDREVTQNAMKKLYLPPYTCYVEQRAMTTKGWRWIAWNDNGILDKYGKVKSIIGVGRDINDRKNAEIALQQSEERYKSLFDSSPVGVLLEDEKGIIISVNDAFCKITGYEKSELIGNNIRLLSTPDKYGLIEQNIQQLLSGSILDHDVETTRKDGTIIIVHLNETTIILPDGRKGILSISEDVTEKKKSEMELKKLSSAVEQSPVTIVMTDLKGDIDYINPNFTKSTGYTSEEVLGKNPRILNSGEQSGTNYKELWETILSGKVWQGEFLNKKKNGELFWESATISPLINKNGVITNFIAVKEDITERKQLTEELILAKEKAEEMNRIKSYFYANMSHELRTPFVGILGYSEMLSEILTDREQKEMANLILSSSKRLTETLNKILDVTKLEFDKIKTEATNFNLYELIVQLKTLFQSTADQKGNSIDIVFNLDNRKFLSDEKLLREILINLLSNAIKYTENGKIKILVEPDEKNPDESIWIKISDTGVGIPKEKQNLIWDEFRQVSEGINRSFEGTGLGLTITKKYTELIGGEINLQSEPGKGSTFSLKLPILKIMDNIKETSSGQSGNLIIKGTRDKSSIRILYVEDDHISQEFIRLVLTREKFNPEIVSTGKFALEKLKEKEYDLLMIDINLGIDMDGLELTHKIRNELGLKTVPIIAITAYATESDRLEFLSKGFTHYLSKPYTINELRNTIHEALNN
ncbi:MAG: PAS domain S-box protein [Ignavibacteriales bacterium]|nr:MAG: PAS domain S-box protein [Ignavibacteriales bacterium]